MHCSWCVAGLGLRLECWRSYRADLVIHVLQTMLHFCFGYLRNRWLVWLYGVIMEYNTSSVCPVMNRSFLDAVTVVFVAIHLLYMYMYTVCTSIFSETKQVTHACIHHFRYHSVIASRNKWRTYFWQCWSYLSVANYSLYYIYSLYSLYMYNKLN